jgi:hypothetical protein
LTTKLPKGDEVFPMALKYYAPHKIYQKLAIPRPTATNPNCDFWYGNIPSGNPDDDKFQIFCLQSFQTMCVPLGTTFVNIILCTQLCDRVARWFIFVPKISIWVNFGGPWNGKYWYILFPFWNILRPFVIIYGHLV